MMLRIESLLVFLTATTAISGLPQEGRGQAPALGDDRAPGGGPRLEARARTMAERGRDGWIPAADMYVRAAELRGPGERRAPENLTVAGHLYYYGAQHEASVLAFRAAGRMFLGLGQLDAAETAFRDGAWVAQQAGLSELTRELCQWIEVLTRPAPRTERERRFTTGVARRS